jgi:cytochrome bd-type quinol oxidase subunit 2
MTSFARLASAISTAAWALAPLAALAQAGGTDPVPGTRNYGWLWILAAVLVVIALFRMFFARSDRTAPPRRP